MRILVVDDDPSIVEVLSAGLHAVGDHAVTTAQSGARALEIVEVAAAPFDAFLLDIQMPGMTGLEVCEALRQDPRHRYTPIIMITAMADRSYIDRAFSIGATDYLIKPIDLLDLKHRISVAEKAAYHEQELARGVQALGQQAETTKTISLPDAIPIDDVPNLVRSHALESYLRHLSGPQFHLTRMMAISVTNAEAIYNRSDSREFIDQIADIAEAISNTLVGTGALVCYFGSGLFGVALTSNHFDTTDAFLDTLYDNTEVLGMRFRNGDPVTVNYSVEVVPKSVVLLHESRMKYIDDVMANLKTAPHRQADQLGPI